MRKKNKIKDENKKIMKKKKRKFGVKISNI